MGGCNGARTRNTVKEEGLSGAELTVRNVWGVSGGGKKVWGVREEEVVGSVLSMRNE